MSGAVDLSRLAASASPAPASRGGADVVAGPFVVDATGANLRSVLETSNLLPVIVVFFAGSSDESLAVATELQALATRFGGRFQLARVDTETNADVAQAFGITGIPSAVAVLQAQPIPLFEGFPAEGELAPMIDRILQAAAQYGITGILDGAEETEESEPELPPHVSAAYAAMDQGDFATAQAEFALALKQNPGDTLATTGLAQADLLQRVSALQDREAILKAAKEAPLSDIDVHLDAADIEMVARRPDAAFARLIDVIKVTSGKERDRVRERLLELFEVIGSHEPLVNQARRALAAALF